MARASLATGRDGQVVIFRCPGCEDNHQIHVGRWAFNGDLDLPTFSPSVAVSGVQWEPDSPFFKPTHRGIPAGDPIVCHSFVSGGRIQFLHDCTHDLVGQTVDLPEWAP